MSLPVFLTLTTVSDGKNIAVNMDHVLIVEDFDTGSVLHFAFSTMFKEGQRIAVKESRERIENLLRGIRNSMQPALAP